MALKGTLRQRLSRFALIILVVACGIIAVLESANEYATRQRALAADLGSLMNIVTESMQPYLAFKDGNGARQQLQGLLLRPDILSASLRFPDGSLLAEVARPAEQMAGPVPAAAVEPTQLRLRGDSVRIHQTIRLEGETLGSLELHVDLRPMWQAQWLRLFWILAAMSVAMAIAYLIAHQLIDRITRPIADLDQAVRNITASRQYDVRVERSTDDELGHLVDRFNAMIEEIGNADGELKQRSLELANQRRFLKTLIQTIPDLVWFKDPEGVYLACNPRFERFFGTSEAAIVGKTDYDFIDRELADFFRANDRKAIDKGGPMVNEELVTFADDGHHEYLETTKTPMFDENGRLVGVLGVGHDISERKEHQKHLEHIAHYDNLTSLPNRVLLADRLRQAMALAHRQDKLLAVVYLDLDGFKQVNDNHGHEIGDKLLTLIAGRMKQALREGDTLARMGGDEFVAVLLNLDDRDFCLPILDRVLAAASLPVLTDGLELHVSASVGVTFFPQPEGVDADQLLRQADQAMYLAKQTGKNRYRIFDAEHDREVRGHHESLERIRQALANGEFRLYYQPKVNMRLGQVIGAEALIRWQHPQRGLLPPALFLPVIQGHRLAIEVGEWVLETALSQIDAWRRTGLALPVSVNIDALHLQQHDFIDRLGQCLARHPGIHDDELEIEVLETNALEDLARVSEVIKACRAIGVGFALDDFGTGYATLTYLKHLPANLLKIDQSFVRDMLDDPDDLAILHSVLELAGTFHRHALAEGVETPAHGELLLRLGCDLAQGYAIARPMPAEEIPGWIARWRPDPAWASCRRISHDDLPILFAAIEHRTWVASLGRHLHGELPPQALPSHAPCHFRAWLADVGRARHAGQPALERLATLHDDLHRLADELLQLKQAGQAGLALARLGEIEDLHNRFIEQMQELVDHCGQD
ncbi:MAG: EAL domain-containing protein [Thiobacillus sp.]|nr:EAL domain-containing protein [Thiobacillus sp.]